jgi:hypothetical protein
MRGLQINSVTHFELSYLCFLLTSFPRLVKLCVAITKIANFFLTEPQFYVIYFGNNVDWYC